MPKETSLIPPKKVGSITGLLIVSSLILSLWGRGDGPAWAQWLGPSFLGCALLVPGILFLFDPQLSISWFRAMKPRRRDGHTTEPLLWQHLKTGDRILVSIGIFAVSAVGVFILINTVPNLLRVWGVF
jgi:hypothetical protein